MLNPSSDNESLRILRIASDIYPEVTGGLSLHVHHMSRVQGEQGHDVTVLASDGGDRNLPKEEVRDGYTVRFHKEIASPLGNSIVPSIAKSISDLVPQYDIIHAHSHLFFSTNLSALLMRRNETPLVITNHGLISQTGPMWLQRLFLPTIAQFTLNSADRVLCYTETDEMRLRNIGVSTPVAVIPNGVDCSLFRPLDRIPEEQQLLYVGRLKESKGVHQLVKSFVKLRQSYEDLTLKIVGEGPLREQLIATADNNGVREAVTFTGAIANDTLPEIYNESSIVVLPSQNEGLPRIVLEALACETPVVATDLPQLQTVLQNAGKTVPDNSPQTLCNALATLLDDPERRRKMGQKGRNRVMNDHSWENTVSETISEYYNLLSENSGPWTTQAGTDF